MKRLTTGSGAGPVKYLVVIDDASKPCRSPLDVALEQAFDYFVSRALEIHIMAFGRDSRNFQSKSIVTGSPGVCRY